MLAGYGSKGKLSIRLAGYGLKGDNDGGGGFVGGDEC